MKILLLMLFAVALQAQNDTLFLDDDSMVIGTGGIKILKNGDNFVIDGSGITEFVPVDTIMIWENEPCDMEYFDPETGIGYSCNVLHGKIEKMYIILRNAAGVEKRERLRITDATMIIKNPSAISVTPLNDSLDGGTTIFKVKEK